MTPKNISTATTALLVFVAVALLFSPIFGHQFGYINDYRVFEYDNHKCCFGFPETRQLFAIGRPLQAIFLNIQLLFVNDIQSFQLIRLFFVTLLGVAATLFIIYLQHSLNIRRYSAALLALLTFTLPSMAINSFWVAQSIPGIVPLFFVLLAHFLMQKWNVSHSNKTLIIASVFSLIFLSLLIYPPATFFFLTLTFIKFVFGTKDPNQARLPSLITEVMVLLTACIAYFLSVKYILKPILLASNIGGMDFKSQYQNIEAANTAYSFLLSFDLANKITRIHDLFIMVLSAWFPPLPISALIPVSLVYILILTWASMDTPYLMHLKTTSKVLWGLVLSVCIPFLAAIPVLVGQGNYPILYRVTFASMATVPVLIVFAIDRALVAGKSWKGFVPIIVVSTGLIFAAEISSYYRLKLIVSRLSAEYQHVLDRVVGENFAETRNIRISPLVSPLDPFRFLYRDFGYTAVNVMTTGMVNAVARTTGRDIDGYRIVYDPLGPRYRAYISDGILFSRDGYPSFVSSYKGISGREAWGRWTDSREAVIEFVQPLPRTFTLKIKAGTSSALVGKQIEVVVGNTRLEAIFNSQEPTEVTLNVATDGNAKSITLKFPILKSPMELGLSSDTRRLGLALINLQIDF